MIPDIDIYRVANLLVKRHGQDASIEAAMRADAMLGPLRRGLSLVSALECPLLGVKQTSISGGWMSAFSHERTLATLQKLPHWGTSRCR